MQKILALVGPTASGKSALAVRLAKSLNGEVISADSRQVYKGLDIGTGKITQREMRRVKHYLLDVISPKSTFTASDFIRLGEKAISQISKRGKFPIICGGTGFYVDALLGEVALADVPPNEKLREKLRKKSAAELFEMLKVKHPERAKTIDKHNPVRLIRALEIAVAKKKTPPISRKEYDVFWIGIAPDKGMLREKIHKRLLARMKIGMVKEAERLHKAGLSWKRMEELGLEYRYLALFLQKKISREEMLEQLENKIWQYSKRQLTYWRRNKKIHWFNSSEVVLPWMKEHF